MTSAELTHFLLFVIGALSGLIAGYFLTRKYARSSTSGGSSERLLQQQLAKADDGLKRFSDELESQKGVERTPKYCARICKKSCCSRNSYRLLLNREMS